MYQIKRGDEVLLEGLYLPDTFLEIVGPMDLDPLDAAHLALAYFALEDGVTDGFGESYEDRIFEGSIKPIFFKYGLMIEKVEDVSD